MEFQYFEHKDFSNQNLSRIRPVEMSTELNLLGFLIKCMCACKKNLAVTLTTWPPLTASDQVWAPQPKQMPCPACYETSHHISNNCWPHCHIIRCRSFCRLSLTHLAPCPGQGETGTWVCLLPWKPCMFWSLYVLRHGRIDYPTMGILCNLIVQILQPAIVEESFVSPIRDRPYNWICQLLHSRTFVRGH